MSSNREEFITDKRLLEELSGALIMAKQIKTAQAMGGDSIQFYQSDTGNNRDWSGNLPASPQAPTIGTKIFNVELEAKTQNVLFADLIMELYIDGSSTKYSVINWRQDYFSGTPFSRAIFTKTVNSDQTKKAQFGAYVSGPLNRNVAVKFYAIANDDVTIRIS